MVHRVSPRREFLRFLAGSPLAAAVTAQEPAPATASARDALNVMDFEPLARQALPPAHWGYLATGVDDDLTLRMNREAMAHYHAAGPVFAAILGGSGQDFATSVASDAQGNVYVAGLTYSPDFRVTTGVVQAKL